MLVGTPFSYSRRDSLSSLSCEDSDDDEEVDITIINRVNEAMMARMQKPQPSGKLHLERSTCFLNDQWSAVH